MAVVTTNNGENFLLKIESADGEKIIAEVFHTCFLCGNSLALSELATGGVVYWSGHGGFIALHQVCAEHLGAQLIQDARTCMTASGKRIKHGSNGPENDPWNGGGVL